MLDGLTLDQMRVFVAVVDAGGFRAAASRLNRAPSVIGHAIAGLEAQFNLALFDRSGHRPRLTQEGQTLLREIRAVLFKVDAVRARARGLAQGLELEVVVALDPLFPRPILGRALHALCATHPGVAFRILSTPMGAAIEALRQDACTFAITTTDLPDARIELEALMELSCAAVAAANHPLAVHARTRCPATVSDLADHIQIVAEDPSDLTEGRDYGVLSPVTWRVADNAIKLDLIAAATGWGSLPLWSIERELISGALLRIPVAAFGADGETQATAWIARRSDRPLGPAARALRTALVEAVAAAKGRIADRSDGYSALASPV